MYRQRIAKKTFPSRSTTPRNKKTIPTPSYGSLSGTIQRAVANPETLREDEWLQLQSTIGTKATNEIKSGKRTSWVPEFKGIFAQLGGDWGQVSEPIQTMELDEVNESEVQPAKKKRWEQEDIGISAQLGGDRGQVDAPRQKKEKEKVGEYEANCENNTGLPEQLKVEVENQAGYSLEDVRVHYNSPKPAQLQALAYTQGTEIHVAPGQEEHLPHEAWHVVQQKQGRVKPTMQIKGVRFNDDEGLEKEAEVMGTRAGRKHQSPKKAKRTSKSRPDSAMPLQKVSVIYAGGKKVRQESDKDKALYEIINKLTKTNGEVWFNSFTEMMNWVNQCGKVEGIGERGGEWMNFNYKYPILWAEVGHTMEKWKFFEKLNFEHIMVEGRSERSITGYTGTSIRAHSKIPKEMQKYTGVKGGKALENYWLRSAFGFDKYGWNIDQIEEAEKLRTDMNKRVDFVEGGVEELKELIDTVSVFGRSIEREGKEEKEEKGIIQNLQKAYKEVKNAQSYGLNEIIIAMLYHDRDYIRRQGKWFKGLTQKYGDKALKEISQGFLKFKIAIVKLATEMFREEATPEEKEIDLETRKSMSEQKVWEIRREHYMMKNLEEALTTNTYNPPKIITMGADHYYNQIKRIEELIYDRGGVVIVGDTSTIEELGKIKLTRGERIKRTKKTALLKTPKFRKVEKDWD